VIGAEFASLWRSFGAEVTLVEAMPHLLPAEDEAISRAFERGLRRRKIVFTTGDPFASASQSETGVGVTLASGKQLAADLLLVAVGRVPVTEHLGYLEAGIKLENGFIHTDQRLHTGIDNVYAVGDIVPGQQLAHRGFAQGVFVAEEIAGFNPSPVLESGIPRVTYAEPEVASVGLTEATARQLHGDQIRVAEFNLAANGKSKILATAGLVKVVSLTDGSVLGIHMIGSRVGELIGEAQLIVNWEAKPDDLARLIHAHPTQGEALGEAFLALSGKPLHALS
jgi:dihydrolipoamide dehydrogenase